mmetsp:Transcript_30767/g.36229  ORF Transcript_30767/g.36229 Transcript_30767/m.36229 type:complete len:200 (+) Transcript_30767:1090-1689(+)
MMPLLWSPSLASTMSANSTSAGRLVFLAASSLLFVAASRAAAAVVIFSTAITASTAALNLDLRFLGVMRDFLRTSSALPPCFGPAVAACFTISAASASLSSLPSAASFSFCALMSCCTLTSCCCRMTSLSADDAMPPSAPLPSSPVKKPLPSCPKSFAPQVISLPSIVIRAQCRPPQLIDLGTDPVPPSIFEFGNGVGD